MRIPEEVYPLSDEDTYINWGLDVALDIVNNEPTADVRENVRGNWVFNDVNDCVCSVCGKHEELKNVSNYCPDCGAYMR